MAQTKTRPSTRKSQKSKAKGKPSSKSRPKASSSSKAKSSSKPQSAPSGRNESSKAKLPLVAGGAALAGAVGGMAVGAHQARHHGVLAGAMARRPMVKVNSRDLASAAKEVGTFGAHMGRLASELQQAREGNGKHRSPVEVVLDGLTARRNRS